MAFNAPSPTVGQANPASSMHHFTSTFVLSSTPGSKNVLLEVPKALVIDPSRKRRQHQKSKKGCENCRRRRLKCNEESPCANCARRGEFCKRTVPRSGIGNGFAPLMPSQDFLSSSGSTNVVDLLQLRLFHHSQTVTRQTLLFTPEAWDRVLQLSFNFDYLMNALLCVAARHLSYLQPDDGAYPTAAASHLCRALAGFRLELSNDLTSTHLDVFIATSVLLQFELWINSDLLSPQSDGGISLDSSKDCLFTFSSSLKEVFLRSFPGAAIQASEFMAYLRDNPMDVLVKAARIGNETLAEYQEFFSYNRPLTLDLLNASPPYIRRKDEINFYLWQQHAPKTPGRSGPIKGDYKPVVTRLCLILSFIPEAGQPTLADAQSPLLSILARFILLFPIMCHGPFASMVHELDPHALFVLYHFYRSVRILLSPREYWWAHKRATVLEEALKEWLTKRCQHPQ